jgi:hypothetical protein
MAFTTTTNGSRKRRPDRKEKHREVVNRARARGRDLRRAMEAEGVTISEKTGLPVAKHQDRKRRASESLEVFAREYMPHVFTLTMSGGQKADVQTMQRVCAKGGRYAFAAPRGDGKTSRVEAAVLWAALFGHRRCIVIVGADLGAAQEIADSIKLELRTNERLRADFPIPCWAAALSEDQALKAKGWTWAGKDLAMRWGKGSIVLPILDGSDGSGCVITPRGITGRLRGMRLKVGKRAVRPDLFAIDDPQTDESAASPAQVATRETLILGAIMGSRGPQATIGAMMPCTIIKHNDLAARFLDRKKHPDWQGSARGLVKRWPTQQDTLWRQYAMKRRTESQEAASAFYTDNREAMDAGAEVDWPERYTPGEEVSAIQHAENLLCDLGEDVFDAEYQNAPKENHPSVYQITPALVASRVHTGRERGEIPAEARAIVAGTDLNHYGLHSSVVGFANDQTGWLAWYGRLDNEGTGIVPANCPEAEAKRAMYEALVRHGQQMAALPLTRAGQPARVGLWIIDAGYMPDVVRRYVDGPGRALGIPIMPARGYSADKYRPGGHTIGQPREGCHFTESSIAGRFLAFNACYWREIAQRAFLGTPNAPGSLSLYEHGRHTEFSEHVCREKLIEKLAGQMGYVWRWHQVPGWHDYLDALVMTYVGAAWGGIGTVLDAPKQSSKAHVLIYRPSIHRGRGTRF